MIRAWFERWRDTRRLRQTPAYHKAYRHEVGVVFAEARRRGDTKTVQQMLRGVWSITTQRRADRAGLIAARAAETKR